MSARFEAMRARWEAHRNDISPTTPLLHNIENASRVTLSEMDHKSCAMPDANKRFPSNFGGMFDKHITTIRNKALSRTSRHASSSDIHLSHRRQYMSGKSFGQTNSKAGTANQNLMKSQTMSFLPLPTRPTARKPPSPLPVRPKQHVKAVSENRITTTPRISFSKPSALPRSTTHPNFGTHTNAGGRRASDYTRRASKWPRNLEETRPLLRSPLLESPMSKTPDTDEEWIIGRTVSYAEPPSGGNHHVVPNLITTMWSSLNTPRHPSISTITKQDSAALQYSSTGVKTASSPLRSSQKIKHHQLLQPIQPVTPPKDTMLYNLSENTPRTMLSLAGQCQTPSSVSRPVFANRASMQRPTPLVLTPLMPPTTYTVDTAQPNAYWSGRFISLNDRSLNESFDVDLHPTNGDEVESSNNSKLSLINSSHPSTSTQKAELQRAFKVFGKLDDICTTDEARRSLIIFRNMYAIRTKMPELKMDMPRTPKLQEKLEEKLGSSVGSGEALSAESRKMSFMMKLRGRKSSGKSILSSRG